MRSKDPSPGILVSSRVLLQGPRGGRGWGQGGSRPVGPATAGRASNAAAGGRGAVVGQSASMWRDLVDVSLSRFYC